MSPVKPTLADVARHAGVSRTTVSYILNDRADEMRISQGTQDRVRKAMGDLAYRPNRSARSLRTRATMTIGLISDFIASGHFASQMLSGAGAAARQHDHLVVIGETEGDPEAERAFAQEMLDRQVDGLIYARLVTGVVEVPAVLRGQRLVLLNAVDARGDLPSVVPDEFGGGRTAARLLLDLGRPVDVVVVGEDSTPHATAGRDRLAGIQHELAASGRPPARVLACDWHVPDAFEAVRGWLAAGGRAEGLICMNDRVAMGAYQALTEAGVTTPGEVSVVSFDGSELASWLRPRLTSVAIPYSQMGAAAVEVLMSDNWAGAGAAKLPMSVSWGESVGS